MSRTCEFYIECAEKGIFPLERSKPRPSGVRLIGRYMLDYNGDRFLVTGISISDAISWWNAKHDREVPAPAGMREFLEDFAECDWCENCGCVGRRHYFVVSLDGERLCVDCA